MTSASSKHFLNDPSTLVLDALRGLCMINPDLTLDTVNKVVYYNKSNPQAPKVALLCGGGSGHEPSHAGFVGKGMLHAAVCGNIFASPSASQVRRAIELVDNEKGTLIIVKNYTGDVLNFGLAKEQYAAMHPEKADRLKMVIVGDDVAVGKTQGSIVGRRGLAGTCLVYKIAGALAEQGRSLDEVYQVAQWIASRIATIGVGLEHCHVPGTTVSESYLSTAEIEIGMGIHNESGHKRLSAPPLRELIPILLEMLTSTSDPERSFLPFGEERDVILLVNNLGGLSELEMGGIVSQVCKDLDNMGMNIQRALSGSFMTSLNMPGFSITLLLLPSATDHSCLASHDILDLLDETTTALGWRSSSRLPPVKETQVITGLPPVIADSERMQRPSQLGFPNPKGFTAAIQRACNNLINAEGDITHMDTIAGDGDCGRTLKAGASALLSKIANGQITGDDVVSAVIAISKVAEDEMGGTSGALYSIFFSALAQRLEMSARMLSEAMPRVTNDEIWKDALTSALGKLYTYTRARRPSRTLVDPLDAFVDAIQNGPIDLSAIKAAQRAAEATKDMDAKVGRSAYVEGDRLRDQKIPDPGAWGVKIILESLF